MRITVASWESEEEEGSVRSLLHISGGELYSPLFSLLSFSLFILSLFHPYGSC